MADAFYDAKGALMYISWGS